MPGKEKENMADLPIVTLTGAAAALGEAVVERFGSRLRGKLLRPGDADYEEARLIWNGLIDKRPALIARCAGVADVIDSVNFARENDLLVAVRGGGHNVAGNAVCDGGLVIDLSAMKGIRVDPERRTARAEGGATLGDIDRETQVFGLATPLGVVSETGIAGLTLGGGIGWLRRKYGLSSDNLVSVDVVTADGRFLTASETENEDLFWGIRGGGGNFGVVTSFEYRLYPVGQVLGGGLLYSAGGARDALRFYHEFARSCPDELTTSASLGLSPDGSLVAGITVCYCGAMEEGERVLRPLREFGSPLEDTIRPMAYTALQSASDEGFPSGQQHYWKASYLKDLADEAIEVLLRFVSEMPSPSSGVGLQQMHGAASRVEPDATAFPHRDEHYDLLILSQWADPSDSEENIRWARELFEAMRPFFGEGVYVNNLGEEEADRVEEAYGEHYGRLAALKDKYDPTNLFRLNQNIEPASRTGAAS